jgi:hypothetical protein
LRSRPAQRKDGGSSVMGGGLLFWSFYWEERCNKGLERLYLRLSAPNDQRLRIGGPDLGARLRRRPRFGL